jgi:hypothetical protein
MRTLIVAGALGAALLSGCAAVSDWLAGDERQAAELLAHANRVAALDPAAQRRERDAAQASRTRDKSAVARVRLGLLHALPASAIQDDARALALLEGKDDGVPGPAVAEVARFAAAQVRERQRQVADEQKRTDMVEQQLEALKAIERSILERAARRRPEVR